ncbi:cytochrome P450 [Artemisia annua]|uniref:Cytochrome P450 n=1 Tax=Artemisia annua TaxID=35608 RepID=A0A2U1LW24_ARTAN|nr:cytochrome P450 [Artemisia annua]
MVVGSRNQHNKLAHTILTISAPMLIILAWYKYMFAYTGTSRALLPPGPYGLPVVGYLPFLSSNLHERFTKMAHRYGPIFSIRLESKLHIVVNSVDLSKVVVRDLDQTFANRRPTLTALAISYGGAPNISDFIPLLSRLDVQGKQRKMLKQREYLNNILDSMIKRRIEAISKETEGAVEEDGRKDFLSMLLDPNECQDATTSLNIDQLKALLIDEALEQILYPDAPQQPADSSSATPLDENFNSKGNALLEIDVPSFQNVFQNQTQEGTTSCRRSIRSSKLPAKLNDYVLDSKLKYGCNSTIGSVIVRFSGYLWKFASDLTSISDK